MQIRVGVRRRMPNRTEHAPLFSSVRLVKPKPFSNTHSKLCLHWWHGKGVVIGGDGQGGGNLARGDTNVGTGLQVGLQVFEHTEGNGGPGARLGGGDIIPISRSKSVPHYTLTPAMAGTGQLQQIGIGVCRCAGRLAIPWAKKLQQLATSCWVLGT